MSILFRAPLRASCLCVAVVAALFPPFVSAGAGPSSRLVASNPAADGRPDRPAATGADTDATTLDAIEVRASRDPVARERALTPGAVTVVDGASLETRNVTNLAEALRYVPGLWTESSTGGDAIVLSSRGSNLDATQYDGNGIKLFQDGLPVTTADGNNHNRFLDPAAVRQAIVARGANALTYGASNLGGAIDFLSPTARSGGGPKLALDAGSHGLRGARVVAGGVSGDLDGLLTLDALDRDGYR
ncbi:MAG TPA: TonB-dependent receptor plug domain-containing protein, partial [Luteimonas sp.]|nr:TonB-dependent receptor plug domain-containing protein [Luteimonas sp.]